MKKELTIKLNYGIRLLLLTITLFLAVELSTSFFLFHVDTLFGMIVNFALVVMVFLILYWFVFRSLIVRISEYTRSEVALRMSEERYRDLFENANDLIQCIRPNGQFLYVNDAWKKTLGYTDEDIANKTLYDIIHPDSLSHCRTEFSMLMNGQTLNGLETTLLTKDGRKVAVEGNISCRFEAGGPLTTRGILRDITERKLAENKLKEQKEFSENLVLNLMVPTFILDSHHKVIVWNKACEELTGIKAAEVVGTDHHWKAFYEYERECLADIVIDGKFDCLIENKDIYKKSEIIPGGLHGEKWFNNINGTEKYIAFDSAPIYNSDGKLLVAIETVQDFTDRKRAEEAAAYQSYHDPLTGLANRLLFNDRINMCLSFAQRNKEMLALLFLDLDNFKCINDKFGHNIGDQLLKEVAERIVSCLRAEDTVSRFGGDEFIVLIPHILNDEDAKQVANKIFEVISKPWIIDGNEFLVTTSIGIALFPDDGEDPDTLINKADNAMYHAKQKSS